MDKGTILFILTSHALIPGSEEPTGVWMEEFTTPYYALVDEGYQVKVASIKGGEIPIDGRSLPDTDKQPISVQRFLKDQSAMHAITNSVAISNVDGDLYDAIFLPGGHGTMFDLPKSEALEKIVVDTYESGRVIAAVCHGPAGLINATLSDGSSLVKGKRVTAFTNSEEDAAGFTQSMPFLLESELTELGAIFEKTANFESHAIADGNLITGQNPASSHAVAELLIEALNKD